MIETPPALDAGACNPSAGSLGRLFTQCALQLGEFPITLNVHELRAGDVLLIAPRTAASVKRHPVFRFQKVLFDPHVARWTHCGILDENMAVWDAMPNANVRARPLRELLREPHLVAVMRPRIAPEPVPLRLALLMFSNHHYRVFSVVTLGRLRARLTRHQTTTDEFPDDRTVVCSLFVANVLRRATQHGYFRRLPIALPADFAVDIDFTTVPLAWHRAEP